jgi:hypothetical protein
VKYFFIPDLQYWRYEKLPGWEKARQSYDAAFGSATREELRRRTFRLLMDSYNTEAEKYEEEMPK